MNRRDFQRGVGASLFGAASLWAVAAVRAADAPSPEPWAAIERGVGGRLGVAVLDLADGSVRGHRLDERFAMCSTFKWLAAGAVLQRVDAGQERLDRRLRFGREALLPYAPVTSQHVGGDGMTLAALCEAAVTLSDNTAANLILHELGGPQAVTRFARRLGDTVTRLDRREPGLNEARPGDPRDTTAPRAMAGSLRAAVLGGGLSAASRDQLAQWLLACSTNGQRLKAGLPPGWRLGSKTGTGGRGSTNDVGVYWPPGRPPIVVAALLTESDAPAPAREAALAQVAQAVFSGVHTPAA